MTFAGAVGAAVRDLARKEVLLWVLVNALVAAVVVVAFWAALAYWLPPITTGFGWLDSLLNEYLLFGFGAAVAIGVTALLFPALVTTCAGLFTDRIAGAVERIHYPHAEASDVGALAGFGSGLRLIGVTVTLMVCVIAPLWLLFAGTPLWLPLWFGILGYLLGREYFDAVAARRCTLDALPRLRRARFIELWSAGLLTALAFTIPFSALFAPSFGTALMVHVVERGLGRETARPWPARSVPALRTSEPARGTADRNAASTR